MFYPLFGRNLPNYELPEPDVKGYLVEDVIPPADDSCSSSSTVTLVQYVPRETVAADLSPAEQYAVNGGRDIPTPSPRSSEF